MTTSRPQSRLIYSASESDANMLWATNFFAEVPATFPLGLGDALRRSNITVTPRPDPFWPEREFKSDPEVRNIRLLQEIGFRRIRHGVDAFGIHSEILRYFEGNGFPTGMTNGRMQGVFHGTGHGLDLDIHEAPGINSRNHTILKTGHVVSVEPGLYYAGMGGVRLEDVVLVTKSGCRNLVRIPKILEV